MGEVEKGGLSREELTARLRELEDENRSLQAECTELRREVTGLQVFRELTDQLPYGVSLWHARGVDPGDMRLLYTNEQAALEWGDEFAEKVGYSLREAIPEAIEAPAPFNLPVMWHRVAISGTPEVVDPLPYGNPEKPRGWLRAHAVPAGEGLVGMVFDNVSRHIRAERQLHELNRALELRVRERTSKLDDLNHELTAFSYSVSHDLRAPLRSIEGFTDALTEDYGDDLPEGASEHLRRISAAARRMKKRIEGLLLLSRLSRTRMLSETVPISDRASKAGARLQAGLQEPREVVIEVQPGLEVHADPRLIDVLLENLIGNALKFTNGTDPSVVSVGMERTRGTMAFYVRDNGVGFDASLADKMFKPFQRLHREEDFPGTGIGLATVQRIVHMQGGRVWATVNDDGGATIWFTL